jgi:hypothetical protein
MTGVVPVRWPYNDQSIYGGRLADVRRVLALDAALPGLRRVDLQVKPPLLLVIGLLLLGILGTGFFSPPPS